MKRQILLSLFALTITGACSDPVSPKAVAQPGSYEASLSANSGSIGVLAFTSAEGGTVTDWLARGATITLMLRSNGTTTGSLMIPGIDDEGVEGPGKVFNADLAGTWSESNGVVSLSHNADTFLRDMDFAVAGSRLEGSSTFSGTTVRVVLVRTGN